MAGTICGLEGKLLRLGEEISRRFVVINANSAFFFFYIFFEAEVEIFLKCNLYLTDENKYLAVLMIKKILLGYKLKFSDHLSDMLNIALALKFHALTNR